MVLMYLKKALKDGMKKFPHIHFLKPNGVNELDKVEDNFFDIVIFGHSLMVIDIDLYQKVIYQICRVLKKNGHIFINDWYSKYGKRNIKWKHNTLYHCNKFDYGSFFTIFPDYILINRTFVNHESNINKDKQYEFDNIDDVMTLDIIRKLS